MHCGLASVGKKHQLKAAIVGRISEMNITGTLPQAGNLKLFVPSLSTQSSTRPKQNICNVVLNKRQIYSPLGLTSAATLYVRRSLAPHN